MLLTSMQFVARYARMLLVCQLLFVCGAFGRTRGGGGFIVVFEP